MGGNRGHCLVGRLSCHICRWPMHSLRAHTLRMCEHMDAYSYDKIVVAILLSLTLAWSNRQLYIVQNTSPLHCPRSAAMNSTMTTTTEYGAGGRMAIAPPILIHVRPGGALSLYYIALFAFYCGFLANIRRRAKCVHRNERMWFTMPTV